MIILWIRLDTTKPLKGKSILIKSNVLWKMLNEILSAGPSKFCFVIEWEDRWLPPASSSPPQDSGKLKRIIARFEIFLYSWLLSLIWSLSCCCWCCCWFLCCCHCCCYPRCCWWFWCWCCSIIFFFIADFVDGCIICCWRCKRSVLFNGYWCRKSSMV